MWFGIGMVLYFALGYLLTMHILSRWLFIGYHEFMPILMVWPLFIAIVVVEAIAIKLKHSNDKGQSNGKG